MEEREDTVGRLLEGTTNFSRAERDEIFEDVFAAVSTAPEPARAAPERATGWFRWLVAAAVAILAVVPAWLLFAPQQDEFTARGAEGNVELICPAVDGCRHGDTLTFVLDAPPKPWLAAFARGNGAKTIWYFPEGDTGTSIAASSGRLERAVTVGSEHAVGSWTVYFVFSDTAWTRDQVRAAFDSNGNLTTESAALITRTLTVR